MYPIDTLFVDLTGGHPVSLAEVRREAVACRVLVFSTMDRSPLQKCVNAELDLE